MIRSLTGKFSRCPVSNKNREGARMRYALSKTLSSLHQQYILYELGL